jgi:hypothetical protein
MGQQGICPLGGHPPLAGTRTLTPRKKKAGNGTRTRDPNLGKVVLYQLSYSRDHRQSYR